MSLKEARISPLPDHVAAQISSSAIISTLETVVIGLAENSIDASASKIDIFVDFRRGSCNVEDDGRGISSREFEEGGGLGKRFRMIKVFVFSFMV